MCFYRHIYGLAVPLKQVAKCGPNSKMHAVFKLERSWLSDVFRALLPKENITDIIYVNRLNTHNKYI